MFGEFNETAQPKTSLAKYSMEFNYLAVQMRPHQIVYSRLLGRPYTLLYVRWSVGRLGPRQLLKLICYSKLNRFFLSCSLFPFC